MTVKGYAAYSNSIVNRTCGKEDILLMLYEGAVRFVRFARLGIEDKSAKIRGENISKVMAILTELDCALDRESGGDIVENLSALYRYMMDRLTFANTKNDIDALDEVERLLLDVKEGFEGAAGQEDKVSPASMKSLEPKMGVRVACKA